MSGNQTDCLIDKLYVKIYLQLMEENLHDLWNGLDFPSDKKSTIIASELHVNSEIKYAMKAVRNCHEWKMALYIIFSLPEFFCHSARLWKHFPVLFRHNTELCFTSDNKERHRIWLHWQTKLVSVVFWKMRQTDWKRRKESKLFWKDQSLRSAELSEISSFPMKF